MKPRIRGLAAAAILLPTVTTGAMAQDDAVALDAGTASRLFLKVAFATVIIADPAIVDVRTDDARSVVIEPLSPGETNLVFVDARGVVTANVRVSVCAAPPSNGCPSRHSS